MQCWEAKIDLGWLSLLVFFYQQKSTTFCFFNTAYYGSVTLSLRSFLRHYKTNDGRRRRDETRMARFFQHYYYLCIQSEELDLQCILSATINSNVICPYMHWALYRTNNCGHWAFWGGTRGQYWENNNIISFLWILSVSSWIYNILQLWWWGLLWWRAHIAFLHTSIFLPFPLIYGDTWGESPKIDRCKATVITRCGIPYLTKYLFIYFLLQINICSL